MRPLAVSDANSIKVHTRCLLDDHLPKPSPLFRNLPCTAVYQDQPNAAQPQRQIAMASLYTFHRMWCSTQLLSPLFGFAPALLTHILLAHAPTCAGLTHEHRLWTRGAARWPHPVPPRATHPPPAAAPQRQVHRAGLPTAAAGVAAAGATPRHLGVLRLGQRQAVAVELAVELAVERVLVLVPATVLVQLCQSPSSPRPRLSRCGWRMSAHKSGSICSQSGPRKLICSFASFGCLAFPARGTPESPRVRPLTTALPLSSRFSTKKRSKLKSRVRKGVPEAVRGVVWRKIVGADIRQSDPRNKGAVRVALSSSLTCGPICGLC